MVAPITNAITTTPNLIARFDALGGFYMPHSQPPTEFSIKKINAHQAKM